MKGKKNKDRIDRIFRVIDNCQSIEEIQQAVERFGYDDRKFEEGKALRKSLMESFKEKSRTHDEYHKAVAYERECRSSAEETYKSHVQLARIIIKNKEGLTIPWQCRQKQKRNFGKWVNYAYQFYDVVLKTQGWLECFKEYNIYEENLVSGKQMVAAAVNARKKKLELNEKAVESTVRKDELFKKVEDWCSDLLAIAKIALGKNSPHLNALTG